MTATVAVGGAATAGVALSLCVFSLLRGESGVLELVRESTPCFPAVESG